MVDVVCLIVFRKKTARIIRAEEILIGVACVGFVGCLFSGFLGNVCDGITMGLKGRRSTMGVCFLWAFFLLVLVSVAAASSYGVFVYWQRK